jgi:hypothetical protein
MTFRPQSAREREEWKKFQEEDQREQAAILERIEAPLKLKRLESEISQNTAKLWREKRKQVLGVVEEAYVPDDIWRMKFNDADEVHKFTSAEASAFCDDRTLGWKGTPENIETLLSYFYNRPEVPRCFGVPVVDRRMYRAAFLSLKGAGVFDEDVPKPSPKPVAELAPVPAQEDIERLPRLPLNHQSPIAYKQESHGSQEGRDLMTGERRVYSSYEIDMLSSDDYKRAFGVPTTYLTKNSFLR